ncbi:type II toxin-antitoxin system PemK/MazF family toxin [Paenibacillus xylanexedens]|uniref:type II toxin-antitoxin system PemK/MazF family toxin n=1 Tax=Paenibacillus xylanexedens TaxID=528191 RepID=UPI000F53ACCE|nr:type II toxin-antitoxin system PemK/MazF family toxin [Paenibacillus xylanexedens]RPK16426.1 hypothetical protein EDO6_03087 [Paenibacillus xylanexedens]
MVYINRDDHMSLLNDKPNCYNNRNEEEPFITDIECVISEYKTVVAGSNAEFTSTWLLEKDIWIQGEKGALAEEVDTLYRGRVVNVNPGAARLGREQRFIHPYIVLAEHKETFIGVPITNMAYSKRDKKHYLRNPFEVELVMRDPESKKPYREFRCRKPSVADIRNISGLDKRRIIKDTLYTERKNVPVEYIEDISAKIRDIIAF